MTHEESYPLASQAYEAKEFIHTWTEFTQPPVEESTPPEEPPLEQIAPPEEPAAAVEAKITFHTTKGASHLAENIDHVAENTDHPAENTDHPAENTDYVKENACHMAEITDHVGNQAETLDVYTDAQEQQADALYVCLKEGHDSESGNGDKENVHTSNSAMVKSLKKTVPLNHTVISANAGAPGKKSDVVRSPMRKTGASSGLLVNEITGRIVHTTSLPDRGVVVGGKSSENGLRTTVSRARLYMVFA